MAPPSDHEHKPLCEAKQSRVFLSSRVSGRLCVAQMFVTHTSQMGLMGTTPGFPVDAHYFLRKRSFQFSHVTSRHERKMDVFGRFQPLG